MTRIAEALARTDAGRVAAPDPLTVPWDFAGAAERPSLPPAAAPNPSPAPSVPAAPVFIGSPAEPETPPEPGPYAARFVTSGRLPPAVIEQYRGLAATLHNLQREQNIRIVMIASALSGEGKTLLASNVALALSQSYGRRVLLVDADLRRPSLHTAFGIPNSTGITNTLGPGRPGPVPAVQVAQGLTIVPAGPPVSDPMHIVTCLEMQQFLAEAAAHYDWVVVDTPPAGLLPDAGLLATAVDRILLVVRAGQTPYDAVQRAIESLGTDRLLGSVLNYADPTELGPYAADGGYEYYEYIADDGTDVN